MRLYSAKVDLHVHSKASSKSAGWFTKLLRCPESYTEPLILYQTLKRRGMDYVTITDHDTIDGVLEIAHLPDVFLGCEYTVEFPDLHAKIHVLVYGISEEDHRDLMGLRENVYEFVSYLKEKGLAHSLAHPLYSVEGTKITKELVERFVLLFDNWEIINGTRTEAVWKFEETLAKSYDTWKKIHILSEKYGMEPLRSRQTIAFTAGSDDHGGDDAGKTFTLVGGVKSIDEFLEALLHGRTQVHTEPLGEQRLLNTVSQIGVKYIRSRLSSLMSSEKMSMLEEVKILMQNKRLLTLLPNLLSLKAHTSDMAFIKILPSLMLQGVALILKYKQLKDQKIVDALKRELGLSSENDTKIAYLVDTYTHTNGVAHSTKILRELSEKEGLPVHFFLCSEDEVKEAGNLTNLNPVLSIDAPFYPGMKMGIPNLLHFMEQIERGGFSVIHISTPGPLGLLGFLIGKILGLRLTFTYHTDLPSYVKVYTNDESLEDFVRKCLIQIMSRVDKVFSPSKSFKEKLVSWGLEATKVDVFIRGVDTDRFSPANRDGDFWKRKLNLSRERKKVLYVGRVSREKNLDLVMRIAQFFPEHDFVIVGDGPAMAEYSRKKPKNVFFTGYLYGFELAIAYSSSDVFLFPSETETYGLVTLEALSSGLPVLVSNRGASKEHIAHGIEGYVCERFEDYMESLGLLLSNDSLRKAMGVAARRRAEGLDFRTTHLEYLRKILSVSEETGEDSRCDHILPCEERRHKKVS